MTSIGNVEATPLASLTFISFTTGAILYLTGTPSNHFASAAHALMPFQQRLTTVLVDGYTFVEDALPVRQRPGSTVERSAYSPPVRMLASETEGGDKGQVHALLTRVVPHSSSIATFVWELFPATTDSPDPAPPRVSIRPGQAAVLDLTLLLGQPAYQHVAPPNPTSVSDDRIRIWTVSSSSSSSSASASQQRISLTIREKPGGAVTLTLVRKLMSVGRGDLLGSIVRA
jgi:hypothetical protein